MRGGRCVGVLLASSLGLAGACTNDYDGYDFSGTGAAAGSGAGGATGGAGGATGGAGGATGGAGGAGNGTGNCPPGQLECAAGCTDVRDDPANCGSCGYACGAGWTCDNRLCRCEQQEQCGGPGMNADCSGDGRCSCGGNDCRPGETCVKNGGDTECGCNGGPSCGGGEACCLAGCAEVGSDPANCGGCGRACAPDQECQDGHCEAA